ncbi:hypothetical protein N0V83_005433 [Neocucurbitaria cava]|uniref:Uncharacterized protein n=1 Tax=Neocucurbitaria cava TaxID=798079 RepID=A0A9W9CM31_9PLEO|nr:hypothetical protein N0V83_005433 [Neocucurbitaria cava]
MSSTSTMPFRFHDLPSEIRNKIYRIIFCEFEPPPDDVDPATMLELERARHSINTALLRTNTNIHREAYDILIKTNRFVKITSVRGLPLQKLLVVLRVPVVAVSRRAVERFKGYVLGVHLGFKKSVPMSQVIDKDSNNDARTLMILCRDLDMFCQALRDGDSYDLGYRERLQISITMGPVVDEMPCTRYAPLLDEFFSEKTQEALLAPFRNKLRGYKAVTVDGHIDDKLANAFCNDLAREQWSDPGSLLKDFSLAKEEGTRLFRERRNDEAGIRWEDATVDIDKMHASSEWASLAREGGEPFVSQLAELYFLMKLNLAHLEITEMQDLYDPFARKMADEALKGAIKSCKKGYWTRGYKYTPSNKHLAKLRYRHALFLRLQGDLDTANAALTYLDEALRLQPGDAAILRERQNILAWMQDI